MTTPKRILVPTDFSVPSRAALNYAIDLARAFGASIDVVHAFEAPPLVAPTLMITVPGEKPQTVEAWIAADARRQLDALLAEVYHPDGVAMRSHVVMGGPRGSVLEFANTHQSDLIVMGTHGRTGLNHLVMGSVAEGLVRASPIPVLTLRTPKA